MDVIVIENSYSCLLSDNEKLKDVLWTSLRFRDRNYFHNRAYKMKKWDGFVDFFNKKNGKFLTGLLPEVKTILKLKGVEYEVSDRRTSLDFLHQKIDEDFLGNGYKLRDYQMEYIENISKYKRGIIDSKTGSGKTLMMAGIVKNLPKGTKVLILCNRKSLVEQNYNELIEFGIEGVGRVYDKYKEPNTITCSTIQSCKHIDKLIPGIQAIIIDELHLLSSGKAKKLYAKLKNCSVRVGLSATPFKFGGKDLTQKFLVKGWIGPIIKVLESTDTGFLTTKELQDRNILSTVECTFFKVDKPQLKYEVYIDAVTKGIAQNDYLNNMVKKIITEMSGRTLILVDRIEHGDRLKELIPHAYWIQGKDNLDSRQFVIDKLTANEQAVGIATAGILSVGVNVFVHQLVNLCDSNAEHILLQALGRGLRVKSDKQHLKYYDFLFEINQYLNDHSKNRIKILEKQGYSVSIVDL
jgi:superfamily II DNA or RNA helicase